MKTARLVERSRVSVGDEISIPGVAQGSWIMVIKVLSDNAIQAEYLDEYPLTRWPIRLTRPQYVVRR
jgi:hypothetical protein